MSEFHDHAIHIALTTYPKGKHKNYIKDIEKIYKDQKKDFKELTGIGYDKKYLYNPIKYHLFGNFDIAFISLIDTYKFAQKVFSLTGENSDPKSSKNIYSDPINYQIQVGAARTQLNGQSLIEFFENLDKIKFHNPFLMITNLKLNNGLLIGNGKIFIEAVQEKIKLVLENTVYLILNTYNWCEITIIVLSDNIDKLGEKIQCIRELCLVECDNYKQIIKDSLYNSVYLNTVDENKIQYSHCFVDSHSYFGVLKEYLDTKKDQINDLCQTETQWQLKTGHFGSFRKILVDEGKIFKDDFYFKSGKTDYITLETEEDKLVSNYKIYDLLRKTKIQKHIRRLKTTVKFIKGKEKDIKINRGIDNFQLKLLDFQIKDLNEIDKEIKALGLSRQIRMKIMKVFHNYNSNILDPIMYVYIIDFRNFLHKLRDEIKLNYRNLDNYLKKVEGVKLESIAGIEKKFVYYIEAFEDAFLDRVLNNYNYENLHDFNVDFNASATQLISIYDTLVKMKGAEFPKNDFNFSRSHLLARINEVNTESNEISINYNIHHLIDPSLIMATIHKEIINNVIKSMFVQLSIDKIGDNNDSLCFNSIKNLIKSASTDYPILNLDDFDLYYLFADIYIYFKNFNADTSLYWYWHWAYSLQNSSQYNSVGNINKDKLGQLMLRPLFIIELFDAGFKSEISCPVPELSSDWNLLIKNIDRIILKICNVSNLGNLILAFVNATFMPLNDQDIISEFKNFVDGSTNINDTKKREVFNKLKNEAIDNRIFCKNIEWISDAKEFKKIKYRQYTFLILVNSDLIKIDSSNFNLLFDYYLLDCLYKFRKFNSGSQSLNFPIHLLRRDFKFGNPIPDFIKLKATKKQFKKAIIGESVLDDSIPKEYSYSHSFVDPNGDFFIPDKQMFIDKMKENHEIFYRLWDIALKFKKNLFN